MSQPISLQDQYAPHLMCFGCGPANPQGLRIKSFVKDGKVVAEFRPASHHVAFEGMVNGGIIGTLLDCHCNWTAAWQLMNKTGAAKPPCTVTAQYTINFLAPTPLGDILQLEAWVEESTERKAQVAGTLSARGEVTATCAATFVAVKEGHPAFHRW